MAPRARSRTLLALAVPLSLVACGSESPLPKPPDAVAALGAKPPTKTTADEVELDPKWELVTAPQPFFHHASVALDNKRVLITGGLIGERYEDERTTNAAYIFNVETRAFTKVGDLSEDRGGHIAVKLQDGRVLVTTGEYLEPDPGTALKPTKPLTLMPFYGYPIVTSEIFDPVSLSWSVLPNQLPRMTSYATSLVLADGRVLITGGEFDGYTDATILYDPTVSGPTAFTEGPYLPTGLAGHTLTQFADGSILAMGGESYENYATSDVSLLDGESWTPDKDLHRPRAHHTATTLEDGRVLITGGHDLEWVTLSGVEIYDRDEGPVTVADMAKERIYHTASLLPDGRVIVVGGGWETDEMQSTEIFDPLTQFWSPGPDLNEARAGHTMVALGGKLVVIGGMGIYEEPLASVEVLDLSVGDEVELECTEDIDCPGGVCVDNLCQSAPPAGECEGMSNGNYCGDHDGCSIGICRDQVCEITHRLDGERCDGGVCVAGVCKLDREAIPGDADLGPGGHDPGKGAPTDEGGIGPGANPGEGATDDEGDGGGLCSLSTEPRGSTPIPFALALLGGLGLLRRSNRPKADPGAGHRGRGQ